MLLFLRRTYLRVLALESLHALPLPIRLLLELLARILQHWWNCRSGLNACDLILIQYLTEIFFCESLIEKIAEGIPDTLMILSIQEIFRELLSSRSRQIELWLGGRASFLISMMLFGLMELSHRYILDLWFRRINKDKK